LKEDACRVFDVQFGEEVVVLRDNHLVRVGRNYDEANASVQPTYQWLQGRTPQGCPVVVREFWAADGAQAPERPARSRR
jgi:hypothetical protein